MPTPTPTPRATQSRDPAKTRARILKVAIAEFAAKGYSGARTQQIARRAQSNIRMLCHYFGGKDGLYVCVLEEVLSQLRGEELQLDFDNTEPLEGVLQMVDFIDAHSTGRPQLRSLLAFENLNRVQHLKRSPKIREMASPVITLLDKLLGRGVDTGVFRSDVDALHLYVAMVSLAHYSRAHAHTLSCIFEVALLAPEWQRDQKTQMRRMLTSFLCSGEAGSASPCFDSGLPVMMAG